MISIFRETMGETHVNTLYILRMNLIRWSPGMISLKLPWYHHMSPRGCGLPDSSPPRWALLVKVMILKPGIVSINMI